MASSVCEVTMWHAPGDLALRARTISCVSPQVIFTGVHFTMKGCRREQSQLGIPKEGHRGAVVQVMGLCLRG